MSQDDGVQVRVPVAGFHASNHDLSNVSEVVLTGDRYAAFAARGTFKKRHEEVAAWPLRSFNGAHQFE